MLKQGTELTLEDAIKRRQELTAEINWIEWACQIRVNTPASKGGGRDANVAPVSIRPMLMTLLDDRTNELGLLNRHLNNVRITF